ncbi:MAG: FecR domain-containing protein [Lewinellaceae bacterium]|nr:FecR domain-containing protein [Lewinellaceae bacterium]
MSEEQVNILILKHLEGTASEEEEMLLEAWLKEGAANRQHFGQLRQVAGQLSEMDWALELGREADWRKVKEKIGGSGNSTGRLARLPWQPLLRYAAGLLLLLGFGWLLYTMLAPQSSPPLAERVVAPRGQTLQYTLPDGSSVRLNADSYLLIPPSYGKGERRLSMAGEAYFEVVKNASQPFIVDIGQAYVRVLGTAFNLKAYSGSPVIGLAVSEGAVRFRNFASEGLEVQAGQAAEYDTPTAEFRRAPYEPETAMAWLEGRLVFRDTPLSEIFLALERQYNIRVVSPPGIGNSLYSDTVNLRGPVDSFFERLSITLGISFRKDGQQIILSSAD